MASPKNLKSKIPHYVRTKNPVSSIEYKKILKNVKDNKIIIEEKRSNIKILTNKLKEKSENLLEETQDSTPVESVNSNPICYLEGSTIRTTIITPGGTKRKVKPSYRIFQDTIQTTLQSVVEVSPGHHLMVEELIDVLDEEFGGIRLLSRKTLLKTISTALGINVKRKGKKKELYYPDLRVKSRSDTMPLSGVPSPMPTSTTETTDQLTSPIRKKRISSEDRSCRGKLDFTDLPEQRQMTDLASQIDNLDLSEENVRLQKALENAEIALKTYETEASKIIKTQEEIIQLYKEILESGELLGGLLSLSERNKIKEEVKKATSIFNLGIRCNEVVDLLDKLNPQIFNEMVKKLKSDCPLITNILEQLVLSGNSSRNRIKTSSMKMKASVHLLSSLLDIRDQRSGNDLPVLFGLLCLCYGAGPSMIEVLQHLGLSESYQVLVGILRKQLENYRSIIDMRVSKSNPIITYQDNMQVMRTSLRHLRLSKLQKEKVKQGKMWDFTVRGWRAADITGLEEIFKDERSTTAQQKDLTKLTYEDTKIESNDEQLQKWTSFKDRNYLRKLELGLNVVSLTSSELKNATNENLQACSVEAKPKHYHIDVPPPDEEFPSIGEQESSIYPLPISHENQCTNYGVASNLDKFTEEFEFQTKRERKTLSLLKNKKDFDLKHAYERYAFMKALDQHKEDQLRYEQILRGQEISNNDDNDGIESYVPLPSDSEDSDNENIVD